MESDGLTSRKSSLISQAGLCATSLLCCFLTITLGKRHWWEKMRFEPRAGVWGQKESRENITYTGKPSS